MLDRSISDACRILFGTELEKQASRSGILDADTVRQAFRKKALLLHPDRLLRLEQPEREARTLAFIAVREAYEEIIRYLGSGGPPVNDRVRAADAAGKPPRHTPPRQGEGGFRRSAPGGGSGSPDSGNGHTSRRFREETRSAGADSAGNGAGDRTGAGTGHSGAARTSGTARTSGAAGTSRAAGAARDESAWNGFYRGSLPLFRLRTGEFLYYRGLIPWHDLIRAIVWQRNQRPRFGEIASEWNLLGPEDLDLLLSSKGLFERVGEAAERLGILPEAAIRSILSFQQTRQRPIGSFFTGNGLLTIGQLGRTLAALDRHNARFQ